MVTCHKIVALETVGNGFSPHLSVDSIICMLQESKRQRNPERVLLLHAYICQIGLDTCLGNYILPILVAVGSIHVAQRVFDKLLLKTEWSWDALMHGYVECGKPREALSVYQNMKNDDSITPSGHTYLALLKACEKLKDIEMAVLLHVEVVKTCLIEGNLHLFSSLVDMYVNCGMLGKAQETFDECPLRDVVLWTVLISGYSDLGHGEQALRCLEQMLVEGVFPNDVTFLCCLKACINLKSKHKGQQIHCGITAKELTEKCLFLGSTLVSMYAKTGDLILAKQIFDRLPAQDVVSWTSLIDGYAEHKLGDLALLCHEHMRLEGISPNVATYISSLKACACIGVIEKGQEMHSQMEKQGFSYDDIVLCNTLIDMYVKCGAIATAKRLFDLNPVQNVFSWTTIIGGYVEYGYSEEALECLELMQIEGISPNAVTFILCLKACGSIGDIGTGQEIYSITRMEGALNKDLVLGNRLVDMYAKCGLLHKAQEIFDELPARNLVTWNTLIAGYAEHGYAEEAQEQLHKMRIQGLLPDSFTFVSMLKIYGAHHIVDEGFKIHAEIEKQGLLHGSLFLGSALVDMYGKSGLLTMAMCTFHKISFKCVDAWTSLISGYSEHFNYEEVLECLEKMKLESVPPSAVGLACGLKACGQMGVAEKGGELHAELERRGLVEMDYVVANALVDMYVECFLLAKAMEVFERVPLQNVVLWNTLLSGYLEHGLFDEIFGLVEQMQLQGVAADEVTYICILKTSAAVGTVTQVMDIHIVLDKKGMLKADVSNALVDTYAKHGWLDTAKQLFEKLDVRDVVSWNALIIGYVECGQPRRAIQCFDKMLDVGTSPSPLSFVHALKACSILGTLEKGRDIHAIIENQGFLETDAHICCALIHMYGKCNSFKEAQKTFDISPACDILLWNALIDEYAEHGCAKDTLKYFDQMQVKGTSPDSGTFLSILKACAKLGDSKWGHEIHSHIERLGISKENIAVKVVLIHMYAKLGLLVTAQEVFDKLHFQDIASWAILIGGYTEHGYNDKALECYEQMRFQGMSSDPSILASVLRACGNMRATEIGATILTDIEHQGLLETNIITGTALVGMYIKCGLLMKAEEIFNTIPHRNTVLWNTLISGYVEHANCEEAMKSFEYMQLDGIFPDATTFTCSLKACTGICASSLGEDIHVQLKKEGFEKDIFIETTLIDLYAKCGSLIRAQEFFDMVKCRNVQSWNALVGAFVRLEHDAEAIECIGKMRLEGISPNEVTYICSLKACGNLGALEKGQELHGDIEKRGHLMGGVAVGNALLGMYVKCGSLVAAQEAFHSLPLQDVVSWTTLISGYQRIGDNKNVFLKFEKMLAANVKPDDVTFTVMLGACSKTGMLNKSYAYFESMHNYYGIASTSKHHTCIIDLLGRTGYLDLALTMIEKMPSSPNLEVWHSVLQACRNLGNMDLGKRVFKHVLCLRGKTFDEHVTLLGP